MKLSTVCLTGSHQYTDQPLVQYIPTYTKVSTHCTMKCISRSVCTTYTSPLSDRYVPRIPGGTLWYNEPWNWKPWKYSKVRNLYKSKWVLWKHGRNNNATLLNNELLLLRKARTLEPLHSMPTLGGTLQEQAFSTEPHPSWTSLCWKSCLYYEVLDEYI